MLLTLLAAAEAHAATQHKAPRVDPAALLTGHRIGVRSHCLKH